MRAARAAALLALLLLPRAAGAQVFGDPFEEQDSEYQSPQYFLVEIKAGPYAPNIDAEFGGSATPFQDQFGNGTGVMLQGEFDVSLWRPFGTVAVGGAFGWYSKSAYTFKDDGNDDTPASGNETSAGKTNIMLFPISLLAIYRADFLWAKWNVPVIPFVKGGINYTIWWITRGDGSTSRWRDEKGLGGTFGWQVNAGVSLVLDVFERQAARALDTEVGINHTYLFFEFMHFSADGFGSSSALRVGDTTYQGGLAFEF